MDPLLLPAEQAEGLKTSSKLSPQRERQLRRQQTLHLSSRSNRKFCKQLLCGKSEDSVGLLKSRIKSNADRDVRGSSSGQESVENHFPEPDFYLHPEEANYQLTERVLQWLDLAGKTTAENCDSVVPVNHKTSKRVFTANPSLGGYNSNNLQAPRKATPPLKRTESIHHLSLTLNEEELSGNKHQQTFIHLSQLSGRRLRQMSSAKVKTGPVATTQSTAGKGNLMSPKSTTSSSTNASAGGSASAATSIQNSRTVSKGGKKKALGKLGKTESIENQYRSMIHRQLLETSCNTQLAKRQLHIFMPNPKLGAAQSSQNDCDSCLNSLISDASKN